MFILILGAVLVFGLVIGCVCFAPPCKRSAICFQLLKMLTSLVRPHVLWIANPTNDGDCPHECKDKKKTTTWSFGEHK
jgi:hypothetical protein